MSRRFTILAITACVLSFGIRASADPAPADPANGQIRSLDYRVGVGDELSISMLGHDEYKADVVVLPDGTFNYPVLGSVHAAGKTIAEITSTLVSGLNGVMNQPDITVSVIAAVPQTVTIVGAVRTPGNYPFRPGWHILEAVAAAGGPLQDPELTQATLITDGGKSTVAINISGLLDGSDPTQNRELHPGDVLLVQPRDPSVAQVQVTGAVVKPGVYSVPGDGASIMAVLAEAGGPTPGAALAHAQLMHNGETRYINLRPMQNTLEDAPTDVKVVAGDVVLIPENQDKIAVLGAVRAPAVYDIPDDQTITVTQALIMAGGPASADLKNVHIIRRGPNGANTPISVNAQDLLSGNGKSQDVAMKPGDVLFVPSANPGLGLSWRDALSLIPVVDLFYR